MLMASCRPSLPSDIMSRGEMEDVLYDLHLAHFIPEDENDNNARKAMDNGALQHARTLQVLRDYDISEKDWERNINYYTRHAELLAEVYDNLLERMSEDALAMGVSIDGSIIDESTAALDSTNIWEGAKNFALLSYEPQNVNTWQIEPKDSILVQGEVITLTFNAMYINPQATQNTFVQLSLTLDNDSIMQTSSMISSSGIRTVTAVCPGDRSIKKINGMFMMKTRNITYQTMASTGNDSEKLQQALLINDIRLLHKAPTPPAPVKEETPITKPDSLMADTTKMKKL